MTRSLRAGHTGTGPLPAPRLPSCAAGAGRAAASPVARGGCWQGCRNGSPASPPPPSLLGRADRQGRRAGVPHPAGARPPLVWGRRSRRRRPPPSRAAPLNSCGGHRRIRPRPALLARLEPILFQACALPGANQKGQPWRRKAAPP